jgi:hypothetical protein
VPPPSKRGPSKEVPKALKGLWFSVFPDAANFAFDSFPCGQNTGFCGKPVKVSPGRKKEKKDEIKG